MTKVPFTEDDARWAIGRIAELMEGIGNTDRKPTLVRFKHDPSGSDVALVQWRDDGWYYASAIVDRERCWVYRGRLEHRRIVEEGFRHVDPSILPQRLLNQLMALPTEAA